MKYKSPNMSEKEKFNESNKQPKKIKQSYHLFLKCKKSERNALTHKYTKRRDKIQYNLI